MHTGRGSIDRTTDSIDTSPFPPNMMFAVTTVGTGPRETTLACMRAFVMWFGARNITTREAAS